jgi:peptidoglycan/LPS O-acetylase OafA/YrhL
MGFFCAPLTVFTDQAAAILGGYLINLGNDPSYMNGAMWSLSVEFQFYAAAAILAIIGLLFRASPRLVGSLFVAGAAMVYAISVYSRILLTLGLHPHVGKYLIDFGFDYMALGVLLAYLPKSALIGRIVILSFCRSPLDASPPGPDYLEGAGMLFTALCYLALVALAAGGNVSRALPKAVGKLFFRIGERSYTIYLLHFPAMVVAWVVIVNVNIAWAENAWIYAIVQVVATLAILLPVTEMIYRLVELRSIDAGASLVAAWRRWHSMPPLVETERFIEEGQSKMLIRLMQRPLTKAEQEAWERSGRVW